MSSLGVMGYGVQDHVGLLGKYHYVFECWEGRLLSLNDRLETSIARSIKAGKPSAGVLQEQKDTTAIQKV